MINSLLCDAPEVVVIILDWISRYHDSLQACLVEGIGQCMSPRPLWILSAGKLVHELWTGEVKWLVCKKYPKCVVCTKDIEQFVTQRVSEQSTHTFSLRILLRITRIQFFSEILLLIKTNTQSKITNWTTMIRLRLISCITLGCKFCPNSFWQSLSL